MVVLHATDPATIFLSLSARCGALSVADIEQLLYGDRSMMRHMAMRRTLYVGSERGVSVIEASSSGDVAAKERKALEKWLTMTGFDDPAGWLEHAFAETLESLAVDGAATARQMTRRVPRLATRIVTGSGKFTAEVGATSKVLGLMAVEGVLARGRPTGSWTTRQYTWHRRTDWFPESNLDPDEASVELIRWWLERFGPGTVTDLKWWTGWTVAKTKRALALIDVVEVELERGETGFVLSADVAAVDAPDPWVSLLPSLDPTPMGWKDREWYIGDHTPVLFDRNGNIGPTIWADGHIVGYWAQGGDARVRTELFESLSKPHTRLLAAEVERVEAFVDGVQVKPSFPTPGQKELATH